MRTGLGLLTFNRPEFFAQAAQGVADNLLGVVDRLYVKNDGSDPKYSPDYWDAYEILPTATVLHDPVNRGVAAGKNALLRTMLDDGADWLFLSEDDVVPLSSQAVTGYIAACEDSGWQHLSFAHHGPVNPGLIETVGSVSLYPNYVGCWAIYSRECLETVGLFDENFPNCYEHVEHTVRLAMAGFTDPRPFHAADARDSREWLREIPDSWETSTIRRDPDWDAKIAIGSMHWSTAHPETFRYLWP